MTSETLTNEIPKTAEPIKSQGKKIAGKQENKRSSRKAAAGKTRRTGRTRGGTKERIIEAALELFSHDGYDGVGVDQIAEKAGIKGPSLYKHFKSKTEILNALTNTAEEYYDEKIFNAEALSYSPASLQELYDFSMKQVETILDDNKIVRMRRFLMKEQHRNSRLRSLTTKHYQSQIEGLYCRIFREMADKGLIKSYDPAILAMEYVSPVSVLIYLYDREPLRRQEITDKIEKHLQHFNSVYGA